MLLRQLQELLGRIYDIRVAQDVYDFLVTERGQLAPWAVTAAQPQAEEQLLVSQEGDTVKLSLFLDRRLLERLANHDPLRALDARNMADYWTALEGVSHFQYLAWNARYDRPVSLHELEVQAEVDKYAATLFLLSAQRAGRFPLRLHQWLFERAHVDGRLAAQRVELYESANRYAARFCRILESRFLKRGRLRCEGLLRELRHFYRLTHAPKMRHIELARAE